jgi:hypothetical protein
LIVVFTKTTEMGVEIHGKIRFLEKSNRGKGWDIIEN